MELDVDLHLHGLHSGGVSNKMTIPTIAEQAAIKGLDIVGTGDCLHPAWREHIRDHTTDRGNGMLRTDKDVDMLLTTEIEDKHRIHHLLFFPSFEAVEDVYSEFEAHSNDIAGEGRPRLQTGAATIAEACETYGVMIGPAHAFTPWTGIYKEFGSLEGCYGNMTDYLSFLELGLSADAAMADRIREHHDISLLSLSDAHSPWPHRLGREFTRLKMNEASFAEVQNALERHGDRGITLNVGFDPREGKYHCTACINCFERYTLEQAEQYDWKCTECDGRIKKGVKDRVEELANTDQQPDFRPGYVHVFPLAEIIREVVGHASPTTKTVQEIYGQFQDVFPSEIDILTDAPISAVKDVNANVGRAVETFRNEDFIILPGGGGEYGELLIPHDTAEKERLLEQHADEIACRHSETQQDLSEF